MLPASTAAAEHTPNAAAAQRAPSTKITAAGIDSVAGSARFSFNGRGAGGKLRFECALDDSRFGRCHSPRRYEGLAAGPHRFRVRSVDSAGTHDPTPATRLFSIVAKPPPVITGYGQDGLPEPALEADVEPPQVFVDLGPLGLTADDKPAFTFYADEPASFECSIDQGAPTFGPCASPYEPGAPLSDGDYTFRVRAKDTAGNQSTEATREFTVDTTPPTVSITAGPSGTVSSNAASFSFSTGGGAAIVLCKLDSGTSAICTSPKTYNNLADGSHSFEVVAIDAAGNPASASRGWTIDTSTP
jgi:hypothetical protein